MSKAGKRCWGWLCDSDSTLRVMAIHTKEAGILWRVQGASIGGRSGYGRASYLTFKDLDEALEVSKMIFISNLKRHKTDGVIHPHAQMIIDNMGGRDDGA